VSSILLGVDVGGTFTDFVLIDQSTGRFSVGKRLTTPEDPGLAFVAGAREMLAAAGRSLGEVAKVVHGTTLVTNMLIERKGARTCLITTTGFRDVLEIGRQFRYDVYDLGLENPEPLIPRNLRFEVGERLAVDGSEVVPLDPAEVELVVARLLAEGAESVAICLLHGYKNPVHEQAVRRILQRSCPDLPMSLASEVAPEIREYERVSTVAANAYVQPAAKRYLGGLERRLQQEGLEVVLYLMLSSGGITNVEQAAEHPIRILESGPAAGVLAVSNYAKLLGYQNLVSFDMGGTTAKICLISDGRIAIADEFEVARVHRGKKGSGLPVKAPVVEMVEVGAGGGSIAHIDSLGLLKVGPDSAGASPGPACYGQGGVEATVTDADLHLGFLDPDFFLGGSMKLRRDLAEQAIARLGGRLGLNADQAALGIQSIVDENMATATRMHIAERGQDPSRFDLFAFGGAGPVHGYGLARSLGLRRVILPLGAGATSALGLLVAPIMAERIRSHYHRLDSPAWAGLNTLLAEMEAEAVRTSIAAGAEAGGVVITRYADVRHIGQGHELRIPIPDGPLGKDRVREIESTFVEAYRRSYGHGAGDIPLEVLTWRVVAQAPPQTVRVRHGATDQIGERPRLKGSRAVYFRESGGFVPVPVYDRYALKVGDRLDGPAIVEETESTVVVGPSASAVIDDLHNLVMELNLPAGEASGS
jgi:N-methylhydantoinase A